MKKKLFAAASTVLAAFVAAPVSVTVWPSVAEAKGTVSAKVGKPLQEAQALAQQKKFNEALAKAKEADAVPGKTPFEVFVVKDQLTFIYSNLRDWGNAAASAEAALATGQAPASDVKRRVKTIADFSYRARNFAKSQEYAQRYISSYGADNDIMELLANNYYQQGSYAKALSTSFDYAKSAEKAGRAPSQRLLEIARASAFKLGDKTQEKEILFRLIKYYPSNTSYWDDLFKKLSFQTITNPRARLEVFRAQMASGRLSKAADFQAAAQTSLQLGLPGEAKRFVDAGFAKGVLGAGQTASEDKRLQAEANRRVATDKTTIAADAKAAAATPVGNDDVKVAEALETYGDAAGALALIQGGITKPGVKNLDEANVTLGRIQIANGQKAAAATTFGGIKTDPNMTDVARLWIEIIKKK